MSKKQPSLFDGARLTLEQSIALTAQSLTAYGSQHRHWSVSYSGGKDSSATLTVIAHLIATGQVPTPESLTVLYVDTRLELLPLQYTAMQILKAIQALGVGVQIVLPAMDDRFYVYMFGRGVPPPSPSFRWCTGQLKVKPMMAALQGLKEQCGGKFLMLTGVRLGESAARDQRIALSCSRDGAECGQGWYHQTTPASLADTLAPILHWRVCHVWDWLTFHAPDLGYPTAAVADVYGGEEAEEINARTGCIACNVASRETSLDTTIKNPLWAYLQPLKRLKPLYADLRRPANRLRKNGERYADGSMVSNPMRLGPLTMTARRFGLNAVLEIQGEINRAADEQGRPHIDLINAAELARINELIDANTWPDKWSGLEVTGDALIDLVLADGVVQPLLFK